MISYKEVVTGKCLKINVNRKQVIEKRFDWKRNNRDYTRMANS